jgi:hypothetical protein
MAGVLYTVCLYYRGILWIFYVLYSTLLHLPPSDSIVLEDCYNYDIGSQTFEQLGSISSTDSARSHPHLARSYQLTAIDLNRYPARSHPQSSRSYPLSARSHPHSARSHPHAASSHPRSARSHPQYIYYYILSIYVNMYF